MIACTASAGVRASATSRFACPGATASVSVASERDATYGRSLRWTRIEMRRAKRRMSASSSWGRSSSGHLLVLRDELMFGEPVAARLDPWVGGGAQAGHGGIGASAPQSSSSVHSRRTPEAERVAQAPQCLHGPSRYTCPPSTAMVAALRSMSWSPSVGHVGGGSGWPQLLELMACTARPCDARRATPGSDAGARRCRRIVAYRDERGGAVLGGARGRPYARWRSERSDERSREAWRLAPRTHDDR
jgi:hypothetical protein